MSTERTRRAALPEVLQEPVHVDVGEQWADDSALRRAELVTLAARHPPGSVCIALFDGRPEPHLDETQDISIDHTPGHRLEEVQVRNRVKIAR
jgi:hypothetical protein